MALFSSSSVTILCKNSNQHNFHRISSCKHETLNSKFTRLPISLSPNVWNANKLSRDGKNGNGFKVFLRAISGSGEEAAELSQVNHENVRNKARFMAKRTESILVQELERPLSEYMSLPASQYSVLDAERIERVDEDTFRCYVYRFKFFTFEVCPVLLVRVEETENGCTIHLLSCKLEGSPIVAAQNEKFSASMVNDVSYSSNNETKDARKLMSQTTVEVVIDIPMPFQSVPVHVIESSGNKILEQLLGMMLPRFLKQLFDDYKAWASGDASRRPLGTGKL